MEKHQMTIFHTMVCCVRISLSHSTALFSLFSDNLCVTNSLMLFLAVKSAAMKQQDKN